MMHHRGYYSLIQFCPDLSRFEGVNIGVVLYSPSEKRLRVVISRSNQRIRKFFGNQDWKFVNRAKAAIENQLKSQQFQSVGEMEEYISKRANVIQMTSPRPMHVDDLETDVKDLHRRLVGGDLVERRLRIDACLTQSLKDAGVVDMVRKSVKVQISEIKRSIRVPYGYQNGRFNLISPVQFDSDPEVIFSKTGRSAIEGQLLYEKPHPALGEMRLVVVANFDEQVENSAREFVKKTLTNHKVSLYSFEDLGPLMDDIRHSAAAHLSQNIESHLGPKG
jgi:hypothetical protein